MKTTFQVKQVLDLPNLRRGIAVTPKGYVYALTYAVDSLEEGELTVERVRQDWRNHRRDFMPFNECADCYCI